MPYADVIRPGSKVNLKDHDPGRKNNLDKDKAEQKRKAFESEISELQELMFATRDTAVLAVFQGPDTSGKDGAINRVLSYVNVQSCRVAAFKVPTLVELAHDFLWRVHAQTPEKGGMTVFNRSHYEDVLVVRVHELASEKVWKGRYEKINAFEELLADSSTVVLKFFLHISKEEQEKRLLEREADPVKAWKLNVNDWKEREHWEAYQDAYEDALSKCSTDAAQWHIVPANNKWFRDLAVAEALATALRPYREEWMKKLEKIGIEAKAELEAFRSGGETA